MTGRADRNECKDATPVGKKDTTGDRELRLAQAMRQNLKRRKQQARARLNEDCEPHVPAGDHDDG